MDIKAPEHTFEKLKGADNYDKWKRNMLMVLQNAELGDLVDGSWEEPKAYPMPAAPTTEDMERSYHRKKDIRAYHYAKQLCVSELIMMCVPEVQLAIKAKEEYGEPVQLWQYLKEKYTQTGWSAKWALFKQFSEVDLDHKLVRNNPEKFEAIIQDLHNKTINLKLDISEMVRLSALNAIAESNPIVAGILKERARKEEKVPDLTEVFSIIREYVGGNSLRGTIMANIAKKKQSQ